MANITSNDDYQRQLDELEETRRQAEEALSRAPGGTADQARAEFERQYREREAEIRRAYYDYTGNRFEDVPQDEATKARATELGDLRAREIDRGMYSATRASAQSYSRRGMGGSGYATAAQSAAVQSAAAERARARAAAFDQATAEGQRGIVGGAALSSKGDPFLMSMLGTAESRYDELMRRKAQEDALWESRIWDLAAGGAGYAMGGMGGGGGAPWSDTMPAGGYDYYGEQGYM